MKEEKKENVEDIKKELEELKELMKKRMEEEEKKKMEEQEKKAREKFTKEIMQRLKMKEAPDTLKEMSVPELREFSKNLKALGIQRHEPGPLTKFEDRLGEYGLPVLLIVLTTLLGIIIMAVA